jgi:hypothetical protein
MFKHQFSRDSVEEVNHGEKSKTYLRKGLEKE